MKLRNLFALVLCSLTLNAWAADPVDDDDDPPPPPPPKPGIAPKKIVMSGPPLSDENLAKIQKFCKGLEVCNKTHVGKQALCVKNGLKESGILDHQLGGDEARDLARFLRRDGFTDIELTVSKFKDIPESAILVLDAHDPVKDKKPSCPKVYGNVVVKCGGFWIDDQKYGIEDFHKVRKCRTKGIWVRPELIPPHQVN